jgi:hypothetical protein
MMAKLWCVKVKAYLSCIACIHFFYQVIAVIPGPKEPPNTGIFLRDFCNAIKESQQPGKALQLCRKATPEEVKMETALSSQQGHQQEEQEQQLQQQHESQYQHQHQQQELAHQQEHQQRQEPHIRTREVYDPATRMYTRRAALFLVAMHGDFPGRTKLCGRGNHNSYFACMWCLYQVRLYNITHDYLYA